MSQDWMKTEPVAFERGTKDGAEHWPMVKAAQKGNYAPDAIPSNPYHQTDPKWQAYNAGFHFAFEFSTQ